MEAGQSELSKASAVAAKLRFSAAWTKESNAKRKKTARWWKAFTGVNLGVPFAVLSFK